MKLRRLAPVVLLLALAPPPARAGDPRPPTPPQRIRELEHQNAILEMKLRTWTSRTDHLVRLVGSLLEQQDGEATKGEQARRALDMEIGALRTTLQQERKRHEEALCGMRDTHDAARERWSEDVRRLARDHAQLEREARNTVSQVESLRNQVAALEEQKGDLRREVDRLRYTVQRGIPRDTVADALSFLSAEHWRSELKEGDFDRCRVALVALHAMPDPRPGTAARILDACAKHNGLLDTAKRALVRMGSPAVDPLVEAARGKRVDRGWTLWVLQALGASAEGALPWLREVAEDAGAGREAQAAKAAIRKIERATRK